jgi:hypothetical protein
MEVFMNDLRIGIIGLSEGNGHPYSWSAIFNGYDKEKMSQCGFPVIPEYLSRQSFPEDCLPDARVTHVWTQDPGLSRQVAEAGLIETVVDNYEDMIGEVDAVLLARDDAENHHEMAAPFIKAGLPIYIDKPVALSVAEAERIYALQRFDNQIFTCSALAFAHEFTLNDSERRSLGQMRKVLAQIPNSWEKYAVHIVEPVLHLIGEQGKIDRITGKSEGEHHTVTVMWQSGLETCFRTTGGDPVDLRIDLEGDKESKSLQFGDTFAAFKAALGHFAAVVRCEKEVIPRDLTIKVVRIIEEGASVG